MNTVTQYLETLPEVNSTFELIYNSNNPNNIPYIQVIGYIWDDKVFNNKSDLIDYILKNNTLEDISDLEFIDVIHAWEKYMELAQEIRSGNTINMFHWWKINADNLKIL